ncbi:MAG: GNAT family N-acetyltransferase [Haloquadratum sp.]
MDFQVLGWPPDGPTLRLEYRRFAYAGKFVMTNTGKAVVRDPVDGSDSPVDDVVAALAFNADRTAETTLWYRYVTVRADAQGRRLGPRLAAFVAPRAADRGYDRLRIAVNNPFAYAAMYRAGFAWTGRETGLAELVLERPAAAAPAALRDRDAGTYRAGLDCYRERDPDDPEASFLAERAGADPPEPTAVAWLRRRRTDDASAADDPDG